MEVLKEKCQKGSVCVEVFKNRIRLRWTHERERYCLYPGLPNNEISGKAALKLASRIELDIACDNFDPTLAKYKSSDQSKKEKKVKQEIDVKPSLSVVSLFDQFTDHKSRYLYRRSLEKYYSLTTYLKTYFQNTLASAIAPKDAEAFIEWLKPKLEPITLKERVVLLRACWNWAIKENLLTTNPWADLPNRIKIPPRQQPKPFSKQELSKILAAFESHEYYNHYLSYVTFRMLTGVRVSEASGLRWSDVHEDFSSIWIGSSLARGDRKLPQHNIRRSNRAFKL
ncbi:phage integrase SAM-like domain-containing protein [Scytonema sp. UIC 10036]|uniref:phage integrase SAM-like domain-containing protein n=1 Tax=Scytonema sp. UIC 10036 TaxID=2304196 RepID=UPI00140F529E|nr:phage integrase SAM-like domain-containing protein [Scytonema sp. UIC 10036]